MKEDRYYPYGETRFASDTIYTDKLFTGQRDVGLGIYHYNARFRAAPPTLAPGVICQANHAGERSGVGYLAYLILPHLSPNARFWFTVQVEKFTY